MVMHPHNHNEAAAQEIVRALRGPRVLTRNGLADAVHASRWDSGAFERGIKHALAQGRIRALTHDLFELVDEEKVSRGAP